GFAPATHRRGVPAAPVHADEGAARAIRGSVPGGFRARGPSDLRGGREADRGRVVLVARARDRIVRHARDRGGFVRRSGPRACRGDPARRSPPHDRRWRRASRGRSRPGACRVRAGFVGNPTWKRPARRRRNRRILALLLAAGVCGIAFRFLEAPVARSLGALPPFRADAIELTGLLYLSPEE